MPRNATRPELMQDGHAPSHHDCSRPAVPLVVDLDGTLVRTDLLVESLFILVRQSPARLLLLPLWLARGRAHFKQELAKRVLPDAHTLPYHPELIALLNEERARGRPLVLATAADQRVARAVAAEIDLFAEVLASDGQTNLGGENKRKELVARYGEQGFDYAGNSYRDLPVWRSARSALLARAGPGLAAAVARITPVERVFEEAGRDPRAYLEALRPHHWLKNLLVLVPLVAAQQPYDPGLMGQALLAFVAFTLCASSVYLLNDLLDLAADRRHPHKGQRPLASGRLPLGHAVALIPLLLAAAVFIGLWLPPLFLPALGLYFALTLAYSLRLKDVAILDVLILAAGYTLRVMAGALAVAIRPSPWLLAFCIFLFFSLALVKRYAELMAMRAVEGQRAHARGYRLEDSELLVALGVASGYLSVLVLALHITGDLAHRFYRNYELVWLVCILLLYWISHVWLQAHRCQMHDDPLVFAGRDRLSRVLILLMLLLLVLAI